MAWYFCSVQKIKFSLSHPNAFCKLSTMNMNTMNFIVAEAVVDFFFLKVQLNCTSELVWNNGYNLHIQIKEPFEEWKSNAVESFEWRQLHKTEVLFAFFSLQSFSPCLLMLNIQLFHQLLLLRVLACHLHLLVHYIPLQLWYFPF